MLQPDKKRERRMTPPPPYRVITIFTISLLVLIMAMVSGTVFERSDNMCAGCHGNRFKEFCNLLPEDPLSDLPSTFEKGNQTLVRMAVEVVSTGQSGPQSYFLIDVLRVTLSSSASKITIPFPQQQKNNIYPDDKVVFEWTVTGNTRGQDSVRFSLYAHNPHMGCTANELHSYDVTVNSDEEVPGVPAEIEARSGDGFVELTWQEPPDDGGSQITAYEIYRGDDPGSGTLRNSVDSSTFLFNDTHVTNGNTYYYHVRALNAIGSSGASEEVSATPLGFPSPPRDLISRGGDDFAELFWSAPADDGGTAVINYRIYRGEDENIPAALDVVASSLSSYNDTTVQNGNPYRYFVTAVNAVGESDASNSVEVTPEKGISLPAHPTNPIALAGDGFVRLMWDPPVTDGGSALLMYRIYGGPLTGDTSHINDTSISQPTYNHTDVINGEQYSFHVTAVNSLGESTPSETVTATPLGVPSMPMEPSARGGRDFVLLQWTQPDSDGGMPLTFYSIYRGKGLNDPAMLYNVTALRSSFNDTGVICGVDYFYYLSAHNSQGEGQLSSRVNATPGEPASPPRFPRCISGRGYIDLLWESPEDDGGCNVTGYIMYRRQGSENPSSIGSVGPDEHSMRDVNVTEGETYYYRIRAVTALGPGQESEETEAIPLEDSDPHVQPPEFSFLHPEEERIKTTPGEVLLFSVTPDGAAHLSWLLDDEPYSGNQTWVTFPVTDGKEHTITVRARAPGAIDTFSHSWTVEPSDADDDGDTVEGIKRMKAARTIGAIVLYGGLPILVLGALYLIFHYRKRS